MLITQTIPPQRQKGKLFFLSLGAFLCLSLESLRSSSLSAEANATAQEHLAAGLSEGAELVQINFPEATDIKDIAKAISLWTGRNIILGREVTGQVQIVCPKPVTKEEAYQIFLSALNSLELTTVETGKVVKIQSLRSASRGNIKTFLGSQWAPHTDQMITQVIPLKHIDAQKVRLSLGRMLSPNAISIYEPSNTIIINETGYKVARVLEILNLLDVETQQQQVEIFPIKHADPKDVANKLRSLLQESPQKRQAAHSSFKILHDLENSSIIVACPPSSLQRIQDLIQKLDIRLEDPSSRASIHIRPLDYADAKKLAQTLSALKPRRGGIPSSRNNASANASIAELGEGVQITADVPSNSLLITGSRSAYEALNTVIRKLDSRRPQVYIEAEILDIHDSSDLNVDFSSLGFMESPIKTVATWEGANSITAGLDLPGKMGGDTPPTAELIKTAVSQFSKGLSVLFPMGGVNIPGLGKISPNLFVNLMKNDSNTRVLSSPQILTSNNEEASIIVGEKIYLNVDEENLATNRVIKKLLPENVDLNLTLKPNISYSNHITLQTSLSFDNITRLDPKPQIARRKTKQNLTVQTGQTIIISGLMRRSESDVYKKIPILGDIPLFGFFFRNTVKAYKRSNLMVFITSHVIHGANDLAAIYEKKLEDRDRFLTSVYGKAFKRSAFYKSMPHSKQLKKPKLEPQPEKKIEKTKKRKIRRRLRSRRA